MAIAAWGRSARRPAAALCGLALLGGCMSVDDQLRTLQQYDAISATPANAPDFDYTVLIGNLRPLGVEMANRVDRQKLAVAYLGERCPNGRTVSETELATRTPGLSASLRDYAIRVKC